MQAINELDRAAFVERFGPLFEHSPWVAEAAWRDRPFADREELYEALVAAMYAAPRERKLALIRAHPDLAGKAAIEGSLTDSSKHEQASAGLDRLTPDEYEAFTQAPTPPTASASASRSWSARASTPRSRSCAWRRSGSSNSEDEEIRVALEEIAKIARLRLEDAL